MTDKVSRRIFVGGMSASAVGVAMGEAAVRPEMGDALRQDTPGAPPAFGTAPGVGPAVTVATVSEAEKLMQVVLTEKDKKEVAGNWRQSMAPLLERRAGPKKVAIPEGVAPYLQASPLGAHNVDSHAPVPVGVAPGALPGSDAAIAFSPVWMLGQWIKAGKLSSERLTAIYLARMKQYDPRLRCVITLMPDALAQARAADAEIAAGRYRGPLHGIPWGAKDLLDTAGVRTTYGAECFEHRVPTADAAVVRMLRQAGAVLIAKLSMGALALNDIWFGGETMNPWLLEEGSSGSSAGPGAAVAAGLVGFAVGSETEGSIVSPSMRCGITGLRPTFGRVPRTGAMTLCWSLDKLGPMTRCVEDAMLVLGPMSGYDAGDAGSVAAGLDADLSRGVKGLRVGYIAAWMKEAPATEVDRAALAAVTRLGMEAVPVTLPDWPYGSLNAILFAEAAAAFEDITLDHRVDQLKMQVPDAWPNSFRQARFLSAVDYVQADRLRRMVALEMARILAQVDVLLVPGLRDEMLTISNFTGHPSLTLRAGYVQVSEARSDWAPDPLRPLAKFSPPRRVPYGVTLVGRLFEEGTMSRVGLALEQSFGVWAEQAPGFA